MINQQILDYIKEQKELNVSEEEIRKALAGNGWQENDVNEAFDHLSNPESQSQELVTPKPAVTSLPSAMDLLKESWEIYMRKIKLLLGIAIIPTLATFVISIIFVILGGVYLGTVFSQSGSAEEFLSQLRLNNILPFLAMGLLILSMIIVLRLWEQVTLMNAIKDNQEDIGVKEAYRRGWKNVGAFCWISLLSGLAVLGGLILLVIPGIIFAIWFSQAAFVLVAEDLKGVEALKKSKEYVKGNGWAVFGRLFFIGFILWIVSVILVSILGILEIPISQELASFVSGLLLTPLAVIYSFLVYTNLKAMKSSAS